MSVDAPPPAPLKIAEPRLAALHQYWTRKCGARAMPRRADLDPLEMGAWLGNLLLIDVTGAGDFVYRLYGTKFVDSFGVDMTGHRVDELPPEQQERVRSDYEAVSESRAPRVRLYTADFESPSSSHKPAAPSQVVTWERLVLPLSEDGARVTMMLVGAYPLADLKPST